MPQYRDPVVHKLCIIEMDEHIFVLKKNTTNEKWSLEKSLSSLIRGVFQLPKSAKFSHAILFLL